MRKILIFLFLSMFLISFVSSQGFIRQSNDLTIYNTNMTNFSSLLDTNIILPSNNQLVLYETSNGKWNNINPSYLSLSSFTNDLSLSAFPNDIGYLTSYTETDPLAYNGTLAYNSSLANYYLKSNPSGYIGTSGLANYYLKSNPYAFYNSTTLTSNSQLTNGAGYITSTSLTPYYLKTNPNSYYNSTTLNNNNQLSNGNSYYNSTSLNSNSQLTNGAGYITSYTETDPIWTSEKSNYALTSSIPTNNNQLTNGAGYISSYTETDPLAYNGTLEIGRAHV